MGILEHAVISQAVVLSDLSSYANMNTLFVVVIVLAVLLLIALGYLISIMSYLKNGSSNKVMNQNSPVNNAAIQSVGNEQVDLAKNQELVAVITAAIYASMGDEVPADGFVVRSIRKVK